MSTIGTVKISELNALDTITDGTKLKIPVSNNDSNTSDPDWESYSVNANVLSYFMENSLGLNDIGSERGLRSQVTDLQSKFDSTLLRNEVGYFSGEVGLSEGQTIGVILRVPTDNSGEFMFCKRIKEITKPIYAGFVYRVKKSENAVDYDYYSRGPVEFPYNRPSINGIAINLTDGCAYVVDRNELKKFIPNANALSAGLMTVADKSKLDNYASTFTGNQKATISDDGLMTSDQVNTLNNALQRVVGYFNGIIDQTIVPEISGTNLKNGTVKFCNSISPILGEKRAGFVYIVNNKYYDIKDVSPDALNALTRPAPFKGGIAINLDDGCAYVVNSTGDMIEKLIDIPESTDIQEATASTAGLMSAKDKSKLDNYKSTFTKNPVVNDLNAGLMTPDQANKLNTALQRAFGYFSEDELISDNQNIVLTVGDPPDNSGEIVFCKKIGAFQGDPSSHAGFVYRVGSFFNKTYYSKVPDGFSYNMPPMNGIAINLKDGYAYVVDGNKLKKFIPEATDSLPGLMTAEDKSKLDNYASTFTENQKATISDDGLMTSDQVNTLNKALQRVVGYFNGIIDQTITLEQSSINNKDENKGGTVFFCNKISLLLGEQRTGFVYKVNGKYYDMKLVSPDILNALTHPVPFKGGIAINLKDGYVYVVNSTGDKIEKLIQEATDGFSGLMPSSVLTRLNNIERRLTALESTATTS